MKHGVLYKRIPKLFSIYIGGVALKSKDQNKVNVTGIAPRFDKYAFVHYV